MTPELDLHALVGPFADGELAPAEADAFRDHLVGCIECQHELQQLMMLAALAQTHAEALREAQPASPPPKAAPVVSLATAKAVRTQRQRSAARRGWMAATAAGLAAAAAGLFLVLRPTPQAPVQLALAETRPLEARLSYGDTVRYRPYEVMRSQGAPREEVSLAALARLEHDRDQHGLGVGYLLGGDQDRAAEALAGASDSAAVLSDRAALALQRHQAAAALEAAEAALKLQPGQTAALWNRALALRELGLSLTAAQSFDLVATHGEPGWAEEARRRAGALAAAEDERQRSLAQVTAAGKAMVAGGPAPAPKLTTAFAGPLRRDLYDAMRTASTSSRRQALLPLADALDPSHALAQRLRALPLPNARLARTYAQLAAQPASLSPGEADAFLAALERAQADDLQLGALVLLGRVASARTEVRRIAVAEGDPWWLSLADEADGEAELAAGNAVTAERLLTAADRRCLESAIELRCAALELVLADAQLRQRRWDAGQATALAALARAREAGADPRDLERRLLLLLAQAARERGLAALANAYVAEARLRMP